MQNIKDRVQPQPKQEWSDEDESHIRYLIECLEHCKKGVALTMTTSTSQEYINWLKDLLLKLSNVERNGKNWKPTKEQLFNLHCLISGRLYDNEPLCELEKQLKKLMEE